MRLDKAVAMTGVSRKQAKALLSRGAVTVNGKVSTDGAAILTAGDEVLVNGQRVDLSPHRHIMMNKPAGVLTATSDARGEDTVMDLLPENVRFKDLGPVGRLDKDVTGLILLTTDGELAHRLISPKRGIEKRYTALCEGRLDESDVLMFEQGLELSDFTAKPARLEILDAKDDQSLCRVYVSEGKFHQVKRMLLSVGHPVLRLRRDSIAGLMLDQSLTEGQFRFLTPEETDLLYERAGLEKP